MAEDMSYKKAKKGRREQTKNSAEKNIQVAPTHGTEDGSTGIGAKDGRKTRLQKTDRG